MLVDNFYKSTVDYGLEKSANRWYSKYRGIVMDTKDPKGLGRIKVKVPQVCGNEILPVWCFPEWMATGKKSGFFWPPDEGDSVTVWFENGDSRYPNYGGGWFGDTADGSEVPDELMPEKGKAPTRRGFRLKNGIALIVDEKPGDELFQLIWSNGTGSDAKKAVIVMDKNGSIGFVSKSGRRLQLDEENKQLFFSDVDGDGNGINTLSADLTKGWVISTASGGTVQAVIALDPSGKSCSIQTQGEVNISAPAIGLDGSTAVGGVKAIFSQVCGELLVQLLTQLITQVSAITVMTGVGMSSPPINAAAIGAIAGQLVTILSKAHKVAPA